MMDSLYEAKPYVAKHRMEKLSDVEMNFWKEWNKDIIFVLKMERITRRVLIWLKYPLILEDVGICYLHEAN